MTATGSEDPTAAPRVATSSADHGVTSHHRAAHDASTFGPRPKPRPSREHPASVREKRQPDFNSAGVLLGTSSRQPISSDPPNRAHRRCRRHDRLQWIRASSRARPADASQFGQPQNGPDMSEVRHPSPQRCRRVTTRGRRGPCGAYPPLERTRTAERNHARTIHDSNSVLRTARRRRRTITNALRTSVPGGGARFPAR